MTEGKPFSVKVISLENMFCGCNRIVLSLSDASHNIKIFKSFLKIYLHHHSFYTLDEYFNYKENFADS
jgi:hypothetical protein